MDKLIDVLMVGLPGKMATCVAEHVVKQEDMLLCNFALTGAEIPQGGTVVGERQIVLVKPHGHRDILSYYNNPIVVDFTQPNVVNSNADMYCDTKRFFVMGTTGGDRESLEERVKKSEISAVIAPNMAKQIVAFQAMMQYCADNFPNVFKGYSLEIVESHQKGKADTSGTAKAMVAYFNALGIPFTKEQIVMIREPREQLKIGVPRGVLGGHAWHTYTLKSGDKTVLFEFRHNMNGRNAYAEGTLDAIRFLHEKREEGEKGKVYSMMDVLKGA